MASLGEEMRFCLTRDRAVCRAEDTALGLCFAAFSTSLRETVVGNTAAVGVSDAIVIVAVWSKDRTGSEREVAALRTGNGCLLGLCCDSTKHHSAVDESQKHKCRIALGPLAVQSCLLSVELVSTRRADLRQPPQNFVAK